MPTELEKRLRDLLGSRRVLDTDLWREIYARDASYFDIKPQCVVRPRNADEVRRVLAIAREAGSHVTFRAGGTSLSGQTVGTGIICELRTGGWRRAEVRDGGRRIWFEPGLTANQVNAILRPHHVHIGPDPASSSAAMMGGILSNNSSGMTAGVKHNSYHTLSSMEFMMADGHSYDSALASDRRRFADEQRSLCRELLAIRSEILADAATRDKIERKYRIKNVTGYAMNSFLEFADPMDIFIHLMIGAEGTLGYIISAELATLPLAATYSSAMLYFPTVTTAAAAAEPLGQGGALAVEMMDYASLRSSLGLKNDLPEGTTAMLVDYGASSPEEMEAITADLRPRISALPHLMHFDEFTHTLEERERLWAIRDGVFPCVAGVREPGSTVILEDVAAPVGRLDSLVEGVQQLFRRHGYSGAIFGHARDGNIHPLVTARMDSRKSLDNFKEFMEGFVDHVLNLEGSLKGEHGTGRAIAPFVAREWGEHIYSLMKRVKKAADPDTLLNPGVIINPDPEAFIKPMKSMDLFGAGMGYPQADKCIECGYCEHMCPTRDITLTPRQRLQARRIIARAGDDPGLRRQYEYIGAETCCADGMCSLPCPMHINTATVTDAVRTRENSDFMKKAMKSAAAHYSGVVKLTRGALSSAVWLQKGVTPYPFIWITDLMHMVYSKFPHWSRHFPMPPRMPLTDGTADSAADPDFIYFPSCVTRIFGGSSLGKDDMITVMMRLAARAGYRMMLPRDMEGLCCSQIWEHKGDPDGQALMAARTVEAFYRLSRCGRVPVVCDTTSCTHTLFMLGEKEGVLSEPDLKKFKSLRIIDITSWLADHVMPRLKVTHPKRRVLLHPTCAARLLHLEPLMTAVARRCAEEVTVPDDSSCCGAAGDRGFIYPEVARSATAPEKAAIPPGDYDGCYSLARTCEISMTDTIGRPYESIIYLVDEATAPAD